MSQGSKWISARAVGAYVARTLDPVARARGFATTTLLSEWASIVGADLAQFTAPDKVAWPRRQEAGRRRPPTSRRTPGATLVLRVDGPRAIEVQHRADQILERVNTYFGYRAVAALRIVQAPVTRQSPRRHSASLEIDESSLQQTAKIEKDGLKQGPVAARLGHSRPKASLNGAGAEAALGLTERDKSGAWRPQRDLNRRSRKRGEGQISR